MEKETKVISILNDLNNDGQSRQHGEKTNPFEKQKTVAETFPGVVINFPEDFYTKEEYYPKETRNKLDPENIEPLIMTIDEIRKSASYTQDPSAKEAQGVKHAA